MSNLCIFFNIALTSNIKCYHSYDNFIEDIDKNENKHNYITCKKEENYFSKKKRRKILLNDISIMKEKYLINVMNILKFAMKPIMIIVYSTKMIIFIYIRYQMDNINKFYLSICIIFEV